MSPPFEIVRRAAGAWAGVAGAVAWQSALLVGVVALVALGMRRSSPGMRYWLWQAAAVKLLVMPLWVVPVALPATSPGESRGRTGSQAGVRAGGEAGARPEDRRRGFGPGVADGGARDVVRDGRRWAASIDWQVGMFSAWGLVVAVKVGAVLRQRRLLERFLRRSEPFDDPGLLALVNDLARQMGLRRRPDVVTVEGIGSPFVCGVRRPRLVMPRGLAGGLEPLELRAVVLHELAHLKRRDLIWDWVPAVARIVYCVHPAADYVAYRARLERELACDQAAMLLTGQDAAAYASTLVAVVSRLSTSAATRVMPASARLDGGAPGPTATTAAP